MTVCVAAMAHYLGRTIVIAASDRMITTGDIEFEQEQMKIQMLSSSIAIMVAGDLTVQTYLIHETIAWANEQIAEQPTVWLKVKDVADVFRSRLVALKRAAAAEAILLPLNLDYDKLVSTEMSPGLAMQLAKEIFDFQIGTVEAIITGSDPTGVHIYVVDDRGVTCQDWVGFAAVGGGAWHANSQLMFAGHVKTRDYPEVLMSVYSAKKRAEVAPGVGEATDMIVIGPGLGESLTVGNPLMNLLGETYGEVRAQAETVRRNANERIDAYFKEAVRDTPIQSQTTPAIESGTGEKHGNEGEQVDGKELAHENGT